MAQSSRAVTAAQSPKVAMVTRAYPPVTGGTETHVQEVGTRLAARGVSVTILTTDPTGRLEPVETRAGTEIRRFRVHPSRGDLFVAPGVQRAIRTGPYDLVHVQGVHTLLAPMALRAAQGRGLPTVLTFHTGGHSNRLRQATTGIQWWAERRALRRADALVAVSEAEARLFRTVLKTAAPPIQVVPNGAERLPVAEGPVPFAGRPLVVAVGRLERYKGHHRLIRAMPALRTRSPGARLVIVGRGPYEGHLRRLAVRLGVANAVSFTAFHPDQRADLGALLAASDVVALLSEYEAHPVAVMEALALGRRVVVAPAPGLEELTHYELVTSVGPDAGPADVAEVLGRVADAPALDAPVLPSWEGCAEELLAIYERVVTGRPGRTRSS